jgi:hypothetical protein
VSRGGAHPNDLHRAGRGSVAAAGSAGTTDWSWGTGSRTLSRNGLASPGVEVAATKDALPDALLRGERCFTVLYRQLLFPRFKSNPNTDAIFRNYLYSFFRSVYEELTSFYHVLQSFQLPRQLGSAELRVLVSFATQSGQLSFVLARHVLRHLQFHLEHLYNFRQASAQLAFNSIDTTFCILSCLTLFFTFPTGIQYS